VTDVALGQPASTSGRLAIRRTFRIPDSLLLAVAFDDGRMALPAPPLTVRLAADQLTGLKLRWLEDPLTIATPPLDHTGVVALKGQAKDLETVIECVPRPR
jgi:hypothetical protein